MHDMHALVLTHTKMHAHTCTHMCTHMFFKNPASISITGDTKIDFCSKFCSINLEDYNLLKTWFSVIIDMHTWMLNSTEDSGSETISPFSTITPVPSLNTLLLKLGHTLVSSHFLNKWFVSNKRIIPLRLQESVISVLFNCFSIRVRGTWFRLRR